MTSIFKLHDTVLRVSDEAKVLIPELPVIRSENKLLSELILCILSSQDKYEVALSVMKSLHTKNVIKIPENKSDLQKIKSQIRKVLKNAVQFKFKEREYSRRLRFFVKKGEYIIHTMENIYLNNLTIGRILNNEECVHKMRSNIIGHSCGLGPKQASMFLRNIGYHSEFAVLDQHVIDYMKIMGLICGTRKSFSSISSYQEVESRLKSYATTYNVHLLHLDLAIWTTMRNLKNYQE